MKTIRLRFVSKLNPLRSLICLGTLIWLALALPAAATSLQLNFTVPSSFNESNRQAELEWNAEPARTYLVQSATNLSPETVWKTEEAVRATAVGPVRWMAPEVLSTQKYYRLILPKPEVFSVEPAFVNSEDPGALFYLFGQCLPTNGSVIINGQNFTVASSDPDGSWVALSLNGLPPGTPIIGSIQVLDNGSNTVATLPLQNPVFYGTEATAEQVQGPPENPPASADTHIVEEIEFVVEKVERARVANSGPVSDDDDDDGFGGEFYKEFKGHVTLLKRGDSGGSTAARHTKSGHVTLLKRGDSGSALSKEFKGHVTLLKRGDSSGSSAARHTKTGHVTLLKRGDSSSSARAGGIAGGAVAGIVVAALSSGELLSEETDLSIPGRGLDFAWTRTYRSRTDATTAQGAGWDFSYNISATPQPDGTVVLRSGNGRADTFYRDGTNGWTRDEYFFHLRDVDQDGAPDEVVFPDGGKWILNPPGTSAAGKLAQIVDRNNNAIRCEYDTLTGRLLRVVDTLDRTNTVAYTSKGLIESVTDFSGRTVRYEYDSSTDLIACVSPVVVGTPNGNDFPGGKTNRFAYSAGQLDARLNHNLVSITDPKGQVSLQVTYQATNNPASLDFDTVSSVLRGVDKKDIRRGMVIARPSNSFATVQTIVNDCVGNVTEYLFDSRQRCVSVREFTGRANPALPTTATENRPTGKLRAEDPDYFETRFEWNADSLCTREIRPDGSSIEISHQRAQDHNSSRSNKTASRKHDGDVRVVRERASSPVDMDGDGTPDTTELAWFYEYDPRFGSPATCLGKVDSAKIVMDRDTGRSKGFGFVTSTIDPRGVMTTSEYDSHGNCTKSIKQGHYAVSNFHIEVDGAYNSNGQLTVVTNAADANGYRRVDTLSYYSSGPQMGYLQSIAIDEPGVHLTTSLEYDERGNVTRLVDPRGNDCKWHNNGLNQCVLAESSSYGGGNGMPPQRVLTQNFFDANDNLVRSDVDNRDENAVLNSPNPQWSTWFEYDAMDRLTGVVQEIAEGGGLPGSYATNRFVYDGNDNLIEARSPLAVSGADAQNTMAFEYDERCLLFREIAAPGSSVQSTTQCDYDSNGNVTRISEGLEITPSITTFGYDGFAGKKVLGTFTLVGCGLRGSKAKAWMVNNFEVHPVSGAVKSEGGAELLAWVETVWNKQCVEKDTTVRLASITGPTGNITTFYYDGNDNLKVLRHFGETNDVPGSVGNRLLSEMRLSYDSDDRCVQQTESFIDVSTGLPIGDGQATTTLTYAPNGACASVADDNGHTNRFGFDTAGRCTSVTGPKANVLQFAYDACDNLLSVVSSERSDVNQAFQQFSTVNTYDTLNRCITSADNVGNTNRYAYDSRDNLVSQLDPRENECFAVFDGLNRCVAITNYVGKERGITINTTHVEYNTNSRRTSATDNNGNTTQYAYDSINRCVGVTEADGTSCSLVWSPRSNLLRQQDANGTVITNTYDQLDRCVSRSITPGPTVAPTTTLETFAYDGFSRCVAASNNVSLSTFAFDSLGNCIRSTQDGLTCSSTYDGEGSCLSRTYPGGRVVTYTYDALDQVASVSSSAGGLPPTSLAQYAYDGAGRIGRVNRGNGISTRIQWNGLVSPPNAGGDSGWQQISRVSHAMAASNLLVDQRTIQQDRSQNAISRVRTPGTVIPGETITLEYDALDRLTNFVRVSGSPDDVVRTYALDGNGNRQVVLENGVAQTYTMDNTFPFPADFQVNQYTTTPFEGQQHDENGNLIVRTTAVGPTFYRYDYADRLVQVEGLSGGGTLAVIASYSYDALGRRVRKIMNPGPVQTVIQCIFSAEDDVVEERVNGILTRTYVLPEVNDEVLVAFNQAGEPQYYHYDDLGNTVMLTDASGTVIERYNYDDYGKVTFLTSDGFPSGAASSAVGNVYCWGGLSLDSETGLHNNTGGGYYDPQMGEWITSIGLPKVTPKISKESHGKFRTPNNPLSGAAAMQKGTVKFFNEAKGFGRMSGGGGTKAQDHNSSRSNKTASTKAQDHNSSRSNKTASTKAQDHNSSRSNKTASSIAPGGGGGGSGGCITVKLIVPIAMDKGLRFSVSGGALSSGKYRKTGHVTLLK